jgi:hypothetical protein
VWVLLSGSGDGELVTDQGRLYAQSYAAIRARLCAETDLRKTRTVDEWILAERARVLPEVNRQWMALSFDPVDSAAVERAECMAVWHSDCISQYALAAADLVFKGVL